MPTHAYPVVPRVQLQKTVKGEDPARHLRRRWLAVIGALVVLMVISWAYWLHRHGSPLRVLVMKPTVPQDERLSLVAYNVQKSLLTSLRALERVAPIDPAVIQGSAVSTIDAAHNAAAHEVLVIEIQKDGGMARVVLRRVREDGLALWNDDLKIAIDQGGSRILADLVYTKLLQAYPDHPPRSDTLQLDARMEDYAEFLKIKQRIDLGQTPMEPELANLDRIIRTSPQFLDARIQATNVAIKLFESSRERAYLAQARSSLQGAQTLALDDPRTLEAEFNVALASENEDMAKAILDRLEASLPGDPEILLRRYRLAKWRGQWGEAEAALRAAAELAPSWRNLYWLADLEARRGRVSEARDTLEKLRLENPENAWIKEKLGYLELMHGDLERAEHMYRELASSDPHQPLYFSNLGEALMMSGRHREASDVFRSALALAPGQVTPMFNLADAERTLGNEDAAMDLYGEVLRQIEMDQAGALSASDETMKAQCLLYLGRTQEALEAVQRALKQTPDNPQVHYEASLVYSVAGDLPNAVTQAEAAIAGGLTAHWFNLSVFDKLKREPGFQGALAKEAARAHASD
jgi:tetratricopeptide (TPR) repeat protein